jgi:S-adenosylmethionine:tRNA ribosyltransferase-isomerase
MSTGRFPDLLNQLRSGDALVLNETRVLAARILASRPGTGGRVELLLVRPGGGDEWWALAKPGRALKPGGTLKVEGPDGFAARLAVRGGEDGTYAIGYAGDWAELMARAGHVPLPPYIKRPDEPADRERYQTVFARVPGAVAAPTAGLHFTPQLLAAAEAKGISIVRVVLHVGPGTFRPVTAENVEGHKLDPEAYEIPTEAAAALAATRARGGRIVAVGTTVVRTLETGALALTDDARARGEVVRAGAGASSLLIVPGHDFRAVDALVTNFHLPRSSLLFLVAAFVGKERMFSAYARAVAEGFRFYSYGDAMFIG